MCTIYPPIWYNRGMDKDKLDRLVIGKMKSYRLSDDYKEFIGKVGNVYDDGYIERMDPDDKIKPVTVKDKTYPVEHVYLFVYHVISLIVIPECVRSVVVSCQLKLN